MRRCRIELARIGVVQSANIASVFDARRLHSQADAEIRNATLARIANAVQHAGDAALPEASGNENAVIAFQLRFVGLVVFALRLQPLGFDPLQIELQVLRERAVYQRFFQRLVRILILHVLADNADHNLVFRVVNAMDQVFPVLHVAIFGLQMQVLHYQVVHAFVGEHQRTFVDRSDILRRDHRLFFHVAEERNLRLQILRQETIGAAKQDVRLNSHAQQLFHRVLCRLRFQLTGGGDKRHQRYMHEQRVLAAQAPGASGGSLR